MIWAKNVFIKTVLLLFYIVIASFFASDLAAISFELQKKCWPISSASLFIIKIKYALLRHVDLLILKWMSLYVRGGATTTVCLFIAPYLLCFNITATTWQIEAGWLQKTKSLNYYVMLDCLHTLNYYFNYITVNAVIRVWKKLFISYPLTL